MILPLPPSHTESVGSPDKMTVSQHSKQRGYPHLSPPPLSSQFCNLCIKSFALLSRPGPNDKPDTDGKPNHSIYNQGFQNEIGTAWMR